jgi:competence protein ComEC
MKKRKKNNMKKIELVLALLVAITIFVGCQNTSPPEPIEEVSVISESIEGLLAIHYLDVGQGDSTFIILPNGKTMLIDAGSRNSAAFITEYIQLHGGGSVDYLIVTHPHEDHIGGIPKVIEAFDIGSLFMPNAVHTTQSFERMLDAIEAKGLRVKDAMAGEVIFEYDSVRAEFIAPNSERYSNLNNYSAVVRLTYNDASFLFMGDAEKESEDEILDAGHDVTADVIRIGHHGSRSSSSARFIYAVSPKYAIISVGENNLYNHPHQEVLDILEEEGVIVLRTDRQSTIVITYDGINALAIQKERN